MEATSSFTAADELVFQEAVDVKTWTDVYLVLSLFIKNTSFKKYILKKVSLA